jgi:hypothetical protein
MICVVDQQPARPPTKKTYKQWFLIRHIRYFFLCWRFNRWWNSIGRYLGMVPNQADLDRLKKVWEGTK